MPADYSILASVYDDLGMGSFASTMIQRIVDFAQRSGWVGRQVTDLGCGAGAGLEWLVRHQKFVTGIDSAPEMLSLARQRHAHAELSSTTTWVQQDIRTLTSSDTADMVTAIDVMNELESTRDLEAVFKSARTLLRPQRWFVFDLHTIEGLAALTENATIIHEAPDLNIFQQNQFDYERQSHTRGYVIFRKQGASWQRQETTRTLRSYPVQAVTALLQRSGFEILHVLNTDFSRYEPNKPRTLRVIIMAEKR